MWINARKLETTFHTTENSQYCLKLGHFMLCLNVSEIQIETDALTIFLICDYCFRFNNNHSSDCPEKRANPQFETCLLDVGAFIAVPITMLKL